MIVYSFSSFPAAESFKLFNNGFPGKDNISWINYHYHINKISNIKDKSVKHQKMGNSGSTISGAVTLIKGRVFSRKTIDQLSYALIVLYFAFKRDEVKNCREIGEEIIVLGLGTEEKDKKKVLEYFMQWDDQASPSRDFTQNTKLYFGIFKLTVTSIEGFKDNLISYSPLESSKLLICHPRTQKPFNDENQMLKQFLNFKQIDPKDRIVVLTRCISPYENYNNCKIPLYIQCNGKPIMFRNDGKAFGYRMFYLKFPRTLLKYVTSDFMQICIPLLAKIPGIIALAYKYFGPALRWIR